MAVMKNYIGGKGGELKEVDEMEYRKGYVTHEGGRGKGLGKSCTFFGCVPYCTC